MTEYRYTKDHEWVLVEDDHIRVGISEFAQSELGEIAFVELPQIGSEYGEGDPVCIIDSLKSTSEIYAPVSGTIVATNRELEDEKKCGIINQNPLGAGWLFLLKPSDPLDLKVLLTEEEYQRYLQEG